MERGHARAAHRATAEMPVRLFDPGSPRGASRVVAPTSERYVLDCVRSVLDDAVPEVRAEGWWEALRGVLGARAEGWGELLGRVCDNRHDQLARYGPAHAARFEVHALAVTPISVDSLFALRLDPNGDDDLEAVYAIAPWYRSDLGETSPLPDAWLVDADGYLGAIGGSGFSLQLLYGAVADGELDDEALARGLACIYPLPDDAARMFEARAERISSLRRVDDLTRAGQRQPR